MSSLSSDTLAKANRVLSRTIAPADHPDPVGYLKDRLREAGLPPEEVDRIYLIPRSGGAQRLDLPSPHLSPDEIVRLARRSLRPWGKIFLAVMAKAELMAERHGGFEALAAALDNPTARDACLTVLGQEIANIIDAMGRCSVTTAEHAILCALSVSKEHNARSTGSLSDHQFDRLMKLLADSGAIAPLFSVKRGGRQSTLPAA